MNIWPDFTVNGWRLNAVEYNDGDGFDRCWYEAVHTDGRREILHVSDFSFQMTKERFAKLVRLGFPSAPRGNWLSETLDAMVERSEKLILEQYPTLKSVAFARLGSDYGVGVIFKKSGLHSAFKAPSKELCLAAMGRFIAEFPYGRSKHGTRWMPRDE